MSLNAPNYQFPADTPSVNTDRGTVALTVRKDANGTLVSADGDYSPLQVDADGDLRVTDDDQTAILTTIEADLDLVNAELDTITAILMAFQIENDANLDLVNAELDAQTVLLTHIDGDLHDVNAELDTITATLTATGTLTNGAETAVAAVAVQVLAANVNRKSAIIQNVSASPAANVRVGVAGVTATTGVRLAPGDKLILEMPYVPTQALFAIRETAVSGTVFAMEVT